MRHDPVGDLDLAAHGVDGDERAGQLEPLEQQRDGIDLVRLAVDRLLPEHQALAARPGRDEMQRMAAARPGPTRGLAVDRHDVRRALAQLRDPGGEAGGEELRRQRVHHIVERVVRGDAARERQQPPQKAELLPSPARDLHEVLRPGQRAAENHQKHLGQWIDHLPRLPRVVEGGEVVEQRLAGHGEPRELRGFHESQQVSCRNPPPVQAIALGSAECALTAGRRPACLRDLDSAMGP